jgi:hypothetical protein
MVMMAQKPDAPAAGQSAGQAVYTAPNNVGQANQVGQPAQPTFNNLWDMFKTSIIDPTNQQANLTLNDLGMQQALLGANYTTQAGQLQQQLGFGLQGIGLDQAQLGIQQGALGRQQQLTPELAQLQRQLFGVQEAGIGAETQQAQFSADQATRGENSSATARGAVNTSGHGQALSDIGTNLQFQLGNIGRQEQSLGVQKQQFELSESEREAQLGDQAKSLDIQSKRLGLSKDQLTNQISNALTQLGLNQVLSSVDIIKAMDDVQNGRFNAISGVLGQIAQVDPSLLTGAGGVNATGTSSGGGSGGASLPPNQVGAMIKQAGFKDPVTALAIAYAENGGNLTNGSVGTNSGGNIAPGYQGTHDQGLFQINNKAHPDYQYDPNNVEANIQEALKVSNGGTNFSAWATYNSGAYKQYLQQARQALGM